VGIDESNGQAVDVWTDQSGQSINATTPSGSTTVFVDNALNFNPAVNTGSFSGSTDGQLDLSDISGSFTDQMSWYMVYFPKNDGRYPVLGSRTLNSHNGRFTDGKSYVALTGGGSVARFNGVATVSSTEPQLLRYNHKTDNQLDFGVNGSGGTDDETIDKK